MMPDPFSDDLFRHDGLLWTTKNGEGVLTSDDDGATWARFGSTLSDDPLGMLVPTPALTEGGTVLASTNLADVWRRTDADFVRVEEGLSGGTPSDLWFSDGRVYASYGAAGIWTLEGGDWEPWAGFSGASTRHVGSSGDAVVVQTRDGLHRSDDDGQRFELVGS